jgi:zinc/manganese transport system substrate-binding protein
MQPKQLLFVICLLGFPSMPAQAALQVFACEPEWAALADEIGGGYVETTSATTGLQDVHHIEARPSLIARLRRADLLVCTGAGLEAGWLPLLQRRANNPRVQAGQPGFLELAGHVNLLGRPARLDRAAGDVHPEGNPHIQLDPRNIQRAGEVLTERLVAIDPAHAEDYRRGLAEFSRRWQAAIHHWEEQAAELAGVPVVVHHDSWVYLESWLGFSVVGTLEPKPGVPPSSAHLGKLLAALEQQPARLVIRSSYQDPRAADWLAGRADIPAVMLPATVGGSDQAGDLFGLFDDIIRRLLEASS